MNSIVTVNLEQLLNEQKRYLMHFYSALDIEQAEQCVEACVECKGVLIFTGVGKSGIIAEKICMTLVSTGTRAIYIPAMNFLHGDIGVVSADDLVVMLSKSGESDELLSLTGPIRRKGAKIVVWTSNLASRMAQLADVAVCLPVEKELCPFDLAPTTSAEVQLLFGDALAIALMRSKGFSIEDYALNHPSGSIGKKATVRVSDLMIKGEGIPLCRPSDSLMGVIVELSNKKCGCLLVVDDEQRLLGVFTDGDLRRALQAEGAKVLDTKMEQLMTRTPLVVAENLLVWEAVKIMQKDPKRYVMVLPVVDQGKAVGLLRMHDIVQAGF